MRRLVFIFTLLMCAISLAGQSLRKPVPAFTDLSSNHIEYCGDSSAFVRFFSKMDSVLFWGKGNLRIVHIGGSHVQAGTLTKQFRNDLLSLRPSLDGGRGLVFPFSAAHTNNPSSFNTFYEGSWRVSKNTQRQIENRLGLSGMALTTSSDKASVTIVAVAREPKSSDPIFRFDSVTVIGNVEGERVPVVIAKGDTLLAARVEDECRWFFALPSLTDSVKVATRGKGEFTLTGIVLDNALPGITVTGIGVNGASLASYLKCTDFSRDMQTLAPDLVILAIGINDATGSNFSEELFIQRYRTLVAQILAVNPNCALLFITNNDSFRRVRNRGYVVNPNGAKAERAFFEIAGSFNGAVWDLYDIMGGQGSMKKWEAEGLARRDKVHFTESGYELVGDLLFNALMDRYVEYLDGLK